MSTVSAPSLMKFFPVCTITIVAVLFAFRKSLANEMIEMHSKYFGLSRTAFIICCIAVVLGLMILVQLIWWLVLWSKARCQARIDNQRIYDREREILIKVFNELGGRAWLDKTRWCSAEPIHRWKGVHLNRNNHRVQKLILPDNRLTGKIPPEISELSYLIELDFRRNTIKGPIPDSLCDLTRMEGLYLHDNYLEGKIPDGLSELPNLLGIYLFNNCFEDIEPTKKLFRERLGEDVIIYI